MDGLGGITCLLKDRRAGPGQALRDPLTTLSGESCFPAPLFPNEQLRPSGRDPAVPVDRPQSFPSAQDPPYRESQVTSFSVLSAPIQSIASNPSCCSERTDRTRNVAYIKVNLMAIDDACGGPIKGEADD